MNIVERVANAEQELIGIKTSQKSQNDSYKFYRFRSDNLYFSSGYRSYRVQFVPTAKSSEQIICNFSIMNYTFPAATSSRISAKVENPLEATLSISAVGTTWSDFQKRIYITCTANCDGILLVTQI